MKEIDQFEEKRVKQLVTMRSVMDYSVGLIIMLIGAGIVFHEQLGVNFRDYLKPPMDKVFGGLWIVYGAWRMYRGYKRNYYNKG
jgi:hypothetical protein